MRITAMNEPRPRDCSRMRDRLRRRSSCLVLSRGPLTISPRLGGRVLATDHGRRRAVHPARPCIRRVFTNVLCRIPVELILDGDGSAGSDIPSLVTNAWMSDLVAEVLNGR